MSTPNRNTRAWNSVGEQIASLEADLAAHRAALKVATDALDMALAVMSRTDLAHVWLNAPAKPEVTPETKLKAALAELAALAATAKGAR